MPTLYDFHQLNAFFEDFEAFAIKYPNDTKVTPDRLNEFINGTFEKGVNQDILHQYLDSYPFVTADELLNGANYTATPDQPDTNNQYLYDGYDAQTEQDTIEPYTLLDLIKQFKDSQLQIHTII